MEESVPSEGSAELADADRQAVYRCFGADGRVLYIGTTGRLGRRLAAHAEKIWFLEVRGITLEWYPDEDAARVVERRAIRIEQPKYNIVHKNGRICPLPGANHKTAAPIRASQPAHRPTGDRAMDFARALDGAQDGLSPQELMFASGLRHSKVHALLIELIEAGVITRVERGRYRRVAGRSARATIENKRL